MTSQDYEAEVYRLRSLVDALQREISAEKQRTEAFYKAYQLILDPIVRQKMLDPLPHCIICGDCITEAIARLQQVIKPRPPQEPI